MVAIVWFRNDLRLADNLAIQAAIDSKQPILPLFIYDKHTSRTLGGASKWWLHQSLIGLQQSLQKIGADLIIKQGNSKNAIEQIASNINISHIFWNRRYDQTSIDQDTLIKSHFSKNGILCKSFNGHLLFEPHTIKNKQGDCFKVFSPFWKHCLNQANIEKPVPKPEHLQFNENFKKFSDSLESLELIPQHNWPSTIAKHWQPGEINAKKALEQFLDNDLNSYSQKRDYPIDDHTSKLSPYLRFGEISVRQLWHSTKSHAAISRLEADSVKFLSEIGWREFAYHNLFYNPKISHIPLNKKFNDFPYQNNETYLKAWQKGLTGYPIVDAGMRELWQTGYMHNRVRMITASFLIKHLLQPWQKGEQWFWDTLVDADIASNPFSWQWVAGCGTDAAPYFRIFNPILQGEKFDPKGEYIKKWIPELANVPNDCIHKPWICIHKPTNYPRPIVDHEKAREECLNLWKNL